MNGADVLPWISIGVTLLLGVLVFVTNRRANKTSEKKLTLEEQQAEDDREDGIAERRRVELERLYERVDKLEATVAALQRADVQKQTTINDQAAELGRTNAVLADVRALFSTFVTRVEEAWKSGHTMPTLTSDEWALLNDTIPKTTYLERRKS